MYAKKLWLRDGEETVVKTFVAHNLLQFSINSIEFASACDDLEGAVSNSNIQVSTTIEAGHLIGSCKTMIDSPLVPSFGRQSKAKHIDVKVLTKKIEIGLMEPWNLKTDARVARVFCSTDKEDCLNTALCSIYNKKRS